MHWNWLILFFIFIGIYRANAQFNLNHFFPNHQGSDNPSFVRPGKYGEWELVLLQELKQLNIEQYVVLENVLQKKYADALTVFQQAFREFNQIPTIRLFEAFLLYKSGLRLSGVEKLLQEKELDRAHFYTLNIWRSLLQELTDVDWKAIEVTPHSEISRYFGGEIELRVLANQNLSEQRSEQLLPLTLKTVDGTYEQALVYWSLVLSYLRENKTEEAARVLVKLLANEKTLKAFDRDLVFLTAGRMLYQAKLHPVDVEYYAKVGKKSDLWPIAREEMAWSLLRHQKPHEAFAVADEIARPIFHGWVNPEVYLIYGLSALELCQYSAVQRSIVIFRDYIKKRKSQLDTLLGSEIKEESKGTLPEALSSLLKALQGEEQFFVTLKQVGSYINQLPWLFHRNRSVRDKAMALKAVHRELAGINQIGSDSVNRDVVQSLKKRWEERRAQIEHSLLKLYRLKLKEERSNLDLLVKKMALLEVELLNHLVGNKKLGSLSQVSHLSQVSKVSKGKHYESNMKNGAYRFRRLGDELWMDELGWSTAEVKGVTCLTETKGR
ncbi:MAG: hypothetical protein NZ480_08865 [Bdellovibrionaceae bacterium]|nr:hypothetical protein [Pseudobdellovibrionaceae bacterium]